MVQSPSNRLLTEAAGANAYRTAAQVDTQADNRISSMLTAQKAQPSGLASLGADGRVPAAQLPATSAVIFTAVKTADTSRVNTAAMANDPHLIFTGLPLGVYRVEMGLLAYGGGGYLPTWRLGMGSAAPAAAFSATPAAGAAMGVMTRSYTGGGTNPPAPVWAYATDNIPNPGDIQVPISIYGTLRITDPVLAFVWAQQVAYAIPTVLRSGSWMRLERMGA